MNITAVKTVNAVMNTSLSYKNPVIFKYGNRGVRDLKRDLSLGCRKILYSEQSLDG